MDELVSKFKTSFEKGDAKDLTTQVGDGIVDIFFSDNVITPFPVFGILMSAYNVTKNFQTYRLAKKIYKLIIGTSELTQQQKQDFIDEYTEVNKEDGAEVLLHVLDKLDNVNKVDILSSLLKNRVKGYLTMNDFVRLTESLQRISFVDINNLEKYKSENYVAGESEQIYSSGLLYVSSISPNSNNKYRLSKLGWQMLKYGLNKKLNIPSKYPTNNSAYAVLG